MKNLTAEEKMAYIAGFFDGEGCIQASSSLSLQVSASNTRRAPLLLIQGAFGGSVRRKKQAVGKTVAGRDHKPVYVWLIYGEPASKVLLALMPYLIVKKSEAILGIALDAAKVHQRVDVAVNLRLAKLE